MSRIPKASRRAFSLIEILVVVVVIGILLGVAVPQWNRTMSVRTLEKRNANLRTLNITADRISIREDGHWVQDPISGKDNWVPDWPLQFKDPIPFSDSEKKDRAKAVVAYFFDEGYLPPHLENVIDLNGVGYHPSGFFVPVAMD